MNELIHKILINIIDKINEYITSNLINNGGYFEIFY